MQNNATKTRRPERSASGRSERYERRFQSRKLSHFLPARERDESGSDRGRRSPGRIESGPLVVKLVCQMLRGRPIAIDNRGKGSERLREQRQHGQNEVVSQTGRSGRRKRHFPSSIRSSVALSSESHQFFRWQNEFCASRLRSGNKQNPLSAGKCCCR